MVAVRVLHGTSQQTRVFADWFEGRFMRDGYVTTGRKA